MGLGTARQRVFEISVQDRLVFRRGQTILAVARKILVVGPGEREQRLESAGVAFERLFAQAKDQRLLGRDALRLPFSLRVTGISSVRFTSAAKLRTPFCRPRGLPDSQAEIACAVAGVCSLSFCRRRRRRKGPE